MKSSARFFLNEEEKKRIIQAIKDAEKETSGEIRIHLENSFKGDIFDRAVAIFSKLKMHKTKSRNGVLIYLAIQPKKFVIIGDAGINTLVGQTFWDSISDQMNKAFAENRFTDGICEAIHLTGEKLRSFFPYQNDDVNELSDDISFGK